MAAYLHLTNLHCAFWLQYGKVGAKLEFLLSVPDTEVAASFELAIVAYLDQMRMAHTDTNKRNNRAPLRHDMLVVKAIES